MDKPLYQSGTRVEDVSGKKGIIITNVDNVIRILYDDGIIRLLYLNNIFNPLKILKEITMK
jgi:hypothetical protein